MPSNPQPIAFEYEGPPRPTWGQRLAPLWWAFCFLALGGGIWAWFQYDYLPVQLPQEHDLTSRQGKVLHVRIEGRSDAMLQLTMLNDGSSRLYPIMNLAAADQAYVSRLPAGLTFHFPLDYVLTDGQGREKPALLLGRTDQMLKWVSPKDKTTHWVELGDLSTVDREFVTSLPAILQFHYPFDLDLTDQAGKVFTASILGRSGTVVKYQLTKDGAEEWVPLDSLDRVSQAFLRKLPADLDLNYPLDYPLTDADGHPRPASIEGRTADVVKITMHDDGTTRLYPIASLSEKDQALLRALPLQLDLGYPFKGTLTDLQGHTLQVTLIGRSNEQLRFVRAEDGKTYTYPIARLSPADQAYVKLLPVGLAAPGH